MNEILKNLMDAGYSVLLTALVMPMLVVYIDGGIGRIAGVFKTKSTNFSPPEYADDY